MITCKIDVTKIEKERLFKGEKGTYLDIVLIETTNNQYGDDYMIVQSVSKEESAQGVRGKILGNARIVKNQEKIIEILEENNTYLAQIANNTKMKDECDCFEDEPIDDNDWDMVFRWKYEK